MSSRCNGGRPVAAIVFLYMSKKSDPFCRFFNVIHLPISDYFCRSQKPIFFGQIFVKKMIEKPT